MVIWMCGIWEIINLWGWTLYWWDFCCCVLVAQSCLTLVAPWIVACQAPLSMGFSRQEDWSGLPFPFLGYLPHIGIEPAFPALVDRFLTTELPGKPMDGITAFLKGTPENILTLFPTCEVREKTVLYNQEVGSHQPESASFILDYSDSRTEKCLLFMPPSLWCFC